MQSWSGLQHLSSAANAHKKIIWLFLSSRAFSYSKEGKSEVNRNEGVSVPPLGNSTYQRGDSYKRFIPRVTIFVLKVVSVCVNGCNFFQWNVKFEKARLFSQSRDLTAKKKTRALLSHYKATLQFPFCSLPTLKLPLQSNPQLLVGAAAQIFWFAWD